MAVGIIDLDDFKPVNDFLGHEKGNTLLIELTRRLK
ncbi:Diguanylate cyclase, predicted domain protein, partial [mine drainage metagenome]